MRPGSRGRSVRCWDRRYQGRGEDEACLG